MKFECNSTCKHAGITGIAIASVAAVYYGVKYVTKRFSKTTSPSSQPTTSNVSTHVQEQVEEKNNASSTIGTSSVQQPITVQQPTSEPTVEL